MTKQVLAIRLLEAITGLDYKKRLQKMIGVPLPEGVADLIAGLPGITIPPGIFSAIPPILIPTCEPGPIRSARAEEGERVLPTIRRAEIDFATAISSEIVAAIAGNRIAIVNLTFTVGGETNITLKSATTDMSGPLDFGGTDEPRGLSDHFGDYPLRAAENEAFVIASSLAVQISGYVTYYLDPVD